LKVLVVDDDEAIRVLVTHLFTRRGDDVQSAEDGAAAIERLASEKFDLVVLDVMMPRADGISVISQLGEKPPPVVIVMTAAAPALLKKLPRQRIAAVVTKPFNLQSLVAAAETAFDGLPASH
jgi:CheY-like chemotaxis protein